MTSRLEKRIAKLEAEAKKLSEDDDVVWLEPEELETMPEMQAWKRATAKVLEHIETEWVIRFLRNFADRLEDEANKEAKD
jgi:hypothetical protein